MKTKFICSNLFRLFLCLALLSGASAPRLFATATNLSAWDGQYEMQYESDGGVPFHHYLIIYTTNHISRVIFGGKELSHVSLTATGFCGTVSGFKIPGTFEQQDGTNVVWLNKDDRDLHMESNRRLFAAGVPLGMFHQTHGRAEAADCFHHARLAMKQYDELLAKFRAALKLPDKQCLEALRPLMEPFDDCRPGDSCPDTNRLSGRLTLPFVRSLKLAGYQHAAGGSVIGGDGQERSLENGPLEYHLWPNTSNDGSETAHPELYYDPERVFCGSLVLRAELVDGQMRFTIIEYFA
jgi:hypothetical protein